MSALLRSLFHSCEGTIAIMWALLLPVLIGSLGLALDASGWYHSKRNLQNAVDLTAIATAYDVNLTPMQATLNTVATYEMQRNGFTDSNGTTLTVNFPPQSGTYAGNTQSIEIIASQTQSRALSALFLNTDPEVGARAVAIRQNLGSACVLALNQTAASAILFQGSSTVNLTSCSVASNSNSSSAINFSGSSTVSTYSINTVGNYSQGNSATVTSNEGPFTFGAPMADPLADLEVPSFSGCDQSSYNVNTTATINPGVYCNGMRFRSKAVVTMNPGVYIVDRGTFDANAGAVVTGNGVTIILTSSTGSDYATININGGASVTLSAMTSGATEGVLMYQDRNAPAANNQNMFNGGADTHYTGIIYFPSQEIQFSGNNSSNGGACTKLIADKVVFTGNSYFNTNCPESVTTVATSGVVTVVE